MVEEERPICKIQMMNKNHTSCQEKISPTVEKTYYPCQPVMKCKLGMTKLKKSYPRILCEKVDVGEKEKCVDMIKLKKEKHEAKHCSFHPKTVCKPAEGKECKMVKKKMCNYLKST